MSELKYRIYSAVRDDLMKIERELKNNLNPHYDLVEQTAAHILFSGGKRLRPLLMVLAARLCGHDDHQLHRFSIVFEYLHAATLLHDDIVDGAATRRGKPVAHSIWGNPTTVLVGDFLLARSLSIAAETGKPSVIETIAGITEDLSQGEIFQLSRKGTLNLTESEYMDIIQRKTAVLIRGACRVGALVADAPETQESALSNYGFHLGIAFQMADDLLDYTAETRLLGKPVGTDIKEGKLTLPVIIALKKADVGDREWMMQVISKDDITDIDFEDLKRMLHVYGGIETTRKRASQHVDFARKSLTGFPDSEIKSILLDVADYALKRKH